MYKYLLLIVLIHLVSCSEKQDALKQFKAHKYNFSNFEEIKFGQLNFKIPNYFRDSNEVNFILNKEYKAFFMPKAEIFFSIEKFNERFLEDIDFVIESKGNKLKKLLQFYSSVRINTLKNPNVSEIEDYNTKNCNGKIIVIEDKESYLKQNASFYFLYVFQHKSNYYASQLICRKSFSSYVADDFKRIINTIR